jgi:hypothetical protein
MCHYAECQDLFIIVLNVIMLSVVILNVVAPFLHRISLNLFLRKKINIFIFDQGDQIGQFSSNLATFCD